MKARLKVILYFILEFILSLVILGGVGLFLIKSTLYSSDFIKDQFKNSDYYSNLYTSINEEMGNIIIQAGLDDSVLENIYTQEMLNETIDSIIDSVFEGEDFQVNTSEVKENLEANINNYLEKNNMKITDQSALDKFTENILKIYEDEMTLSNMLEKAEQVVSKTKLLVNLGLTLCIVIAVILIVIMKISFKDSVLAIPFITVGVILLFGYLLVTSNLVISNIYIWDNKVSNLLQQIMLTILDKIKLYGILLAILGCVDTLVLYVIKEFKRR